MRRFDITPISLLIRYLRPLWRHVLLLSVLLIGSIGLQLVAPQLIQRFLDQAQTGETMQTLVNTAVLFFIIVLSQKIIALFSTYVSEDLGWAATNRLRADLATHCLRLDMGFHKLRTPGELIERIDGDVNTLAESFSALVVQMFGNSLLLIGVLTLIFRQSWQFGLIGLVYALLMFGVQKAIRPQVVAINNAVRQGYANMAGFLGERLAGTEDIRANGGETYVMARLYPIMAHITHWRLRDDWMGALSFSSSYMLYVFVLAATLALAANAYLQGQMSIGTVYLMVYYVGLMESPLKYIRRQLSRFQRAYAGIDRINGFFRFETQVKETAVAILPPTAPTIRFEHVSFAYKDGNQSPVNGNRLSVNSNPITDYRPPITTQTVISDATFELGANRILGILGRTGSGKTTLTRLLFRLYDIDTGTIRLDGVNIAGVALSDLRRHVGMVTQEVQLFAATIRDNLTLFRNYDPQETSISDAQIIAAIETLGLKDWFYALPDGLDTMLKSGGKGLSAGEAQLLAFTRVFLRDPRLVILDEASSRLDPATEQLLERAIDRLLQDRTGLIIAHRLATVQRADDILILENGRIVEHGSRAELAEDTQSRFFHLLQTGFDSVLV
ncbi:MAG: ABC transporter ATP-binding protein [Anaerolineales bacterium]|nr:ABC transporter ATP-binding protein [Anaerolineales bacterium]